eukprot:4622588-Lingulodinium_polyedra.AAC.1
MPQLLSASLRLWVSASVPSPVQPFLVSLVTGMVPRGRHVANEAPAGQAPLLGRPADKVGE